MNKERLEQVFNHLLTLEDESFSMAHYNSAFRSKSYKLNSPESVYEFLSQPCGSVACVIGHSIALDSKENILKHIQFHEYEERYSFDFHEWSKEFFGLNDYSDREAYDIWTWLFSEYWTEIDDTVIGAAKRIAYYLEHGVIDKKLLYLISDEEVDRKEVYRELDKLLLPFYKRIVEFKIEDESRHYEWAEYIDSVSLAVSEPVKTGVITDYMFFIIMGDYHLMGTWSEEVEGFITYAIKDNKAYSFEWFIVTDYLLGDCDWEKSKNKTVYAIQKLKYGKR